MNRIVYVGRTRKQICNELLSYPLEPLIPLLKERYKDTDASAMLKCYAFLEQAKNTFVWRAPFSIEAKYTGDERVLIIDNINLNQSDFDDTLYMQTPELLQLFAGFGSVFFTEKSTHMSVYKASHHPSGIIEFPLVEGTFDIANWFRCVHPAIINLDKKDFSIKKGEPLMYIKFHTTDNVVLKPFYVTEELHRIAITANKVQMLRSKNPLSTLYRLFNRSNFKKVIMNEILKQK